MASRITNLMMSNNFKTNLQKNTQKVDKYMGQLASNRRIVRLSDDPIGVLHALNARTSISNYEQYQRNLTSASAWTEQVDTALQEISARYADISEQVINAATNAKTDSDRKNIAVQMRDFKEYLVETLNASFGGQSLFAGHNTTNKPLTIDADGKVLYNGLDLSDPANLDTLKAEANQKIKIEVGYALNMDVTMTALDVVGIGEDNLFQVLDDAIALMEGENFNSSAAVAELSVKLGDLSDCHQRITNSLVSVGTMQNKVQRLEERYSQDLLNFQQIRSNYEDIDLAETIMDWKMADTVYQGSLSIGSRVIQNTLMDFLR